MTIQLILASGSPRRQELLKQLGVRFKTMISDVDETISASISPDEVVQRLARRKAEAVVEQSALAGHTLVVGADTVVVSDRTILGKPQDEQQAQKMLQRLQGRVHQVFSGIAIVEVQQGKINRVETDYRKTDVWMQSLTTEQIVWYTGTGEPLDKAGAYGIQGFGACMIDKIDGCYFNVVGMSLSLFTKMMQKMGFHIFDEFA